MGANQAFFEHSKTEINNNPTTMMISNVSTNTISADSQNSLQEDQTKNDFQAINQYVDKLKNSLIDEIATQESITYENNDKLQSIQDTIKKEMEILSTRDRMLQLSQERNAYKKKIIYILFSVIITLLIAIISLYYIFNTNKINV